MMARKSGRSDLRSGLTLMEVMIVVAIIGVLAAVAIPVFVSYQARARRSEAFTHLRGIASAEQAYMATFDTYSSTVLPWPRWTDYPGAPGAFKMPWDANAKTAFSPLGWAPEGEVFYSYEARSCIAPVCDNCFTASAYGDVDGDLAMSIGMYAHPDNSGGTCVKVELLTQLLENLGYNGRGQA